jgi:hypothetical protein
MTELLENLTTAQATRLNYSAGPVEALIQSTMRDGQYAKSTIKLFSLCSKPPEVIKFQVSGPRGTVVTIEAVPRHGNGPMEQAGTMELGPEPQVIHWHPDTDNYRGWRVTALAADAGRVTLLCQGHCDD